MSIPNLATLVQTLGQNGLLTPAQMEELTRQLRPRFDQPRTLTQELLKRGWLTPYQANCLCSGRGQDLFLGPYILLERLGEGGSGQVFKARHQHMGREVAIKLIRKELTADAEVVARFYREIQIISQLSHPNIVHAYDAGPNGAAHFLVMEYVEGVDLARLVKQAGPLPVPQACDYIRQAALGLQHAFAHQLVHRDVKPSNLLVAGWSSDGGSGKRNSRIGPEYRWGLVKVLDLGLARFQRKADGELTAAMTPQGAVTMGTPDYLAPEQALDFHQVDIRADIYGLGCTFVYLLTGQPPFPGGSLAQKLMRHQQGELPSVTRLRSGLPSWLDPLLRRMLAKQPEDRFQTPVEVAVALAGTAGSTANGSMATPFSGAEETVVLSGRNTDHVPPGSTLRRLTARKGARWLAGAALCLLIALPMVLWLRAPKPERPLAQVNAGPETKAVETPKRVANVRVLDDFETGQITLNWWPYAVDQSKLLPDAVTRRLITPGKVGKWALQADYNLPIGTTGGLVYGMNPPQDWTKYRQVRFWARGSNSAANHRLEIADDVHSANRGTLIHDFTDNFADWRQLSVPLKWFKRLPSAPSMPARDFNLGKVTTFLFIFGNGKGTLQIDQLELSDEGGP